MTIKKQRLNSTLKNARKEILNGIEYDVFDATLIKKPVMHGILYTNASIESGMATYNDRIVSIAHGEGFDVGTPEEIEKRGIGRVYNAKVVNEVSGEKKRSVLKAELWLNRSQAEKIGYASVIDELNDGKSHDVSVGVVVEGINHDGIDGEADYDFIATKLTLNHLAIIVDGKGECSQDDGCGVYGSKDTSTNQKSCGGDCKGDCCKKNNESIRLEKNEGFFRLARLIAKEMEETKEGYIYIEEIYEDFFVYEFKEDLFKVSYKFKDGNLDISNNEIQVMKKVEYVEVFGGLPQGNNDMYDSIGDQTDLLSLNKQESQDDPTRDELEEDLADEPDEAEDDTMTKEDIKKTNSKGVADPLDPEALKEMLNNAVHESLKPFQDLLSDLKSKSDQDRADLERQVLSLNSNLDADDVGSMALATLKKLATNNQASVDFSANGAKAQDDSNVVYIGNSSGGII